MREAKARAIAKCGGLSATQQTMMTVCCFGRDDASLKGDVRDDALMKGDVEMTLLLLGDQEPM